MWSEHCVGSIEELSEMKTESSEMPPELHRPYVDEITLSCPQVECDGEMIREPYVMDCGSTLVVRHSLNGTTPSKMRTSLMPRFQSITSVKQ